MAGYILRWFTCTQIVTHWSIFNLAWHSNFIGRDQRVITNLNCQASCWQRCLFSLILSYMNWFSPESPSSVLLLWHAQLKVGLLLQYWSSLCCVSFHTPSMTLTRHEVKPWATAAPSILQPQCLCWNFVWITSYNIFLFLYLPICVIFLLRFVSDVNITVSEFIWEIVIVI